MVVDDWPSVVSALDIDSVCCGGSMAFSPGLLGHLPNLCMMYGMITGAVFFIS